MTDEGRPSRTWWYVLSAGAGVVAAFLFAATPLTVLVVLAAVGVLPVFFQGLPASDRRVAAWIVAAGLAVRVVAIGAVFMRNLPQHDDQFVGAAAGDEAYVMGRALRTRAIAMGLPTTKYDYFVAYDEYGRTSFVALVTALQVAFGPTPYSLRLLNALLFIVGALLLFRWVYRTIGPPAAHGGLAVLLFWPTLFVWSISLLKEPLYFFGTALALVSAVNAIEERRWRARLAWAVAFASGLLIARDLRTGAIALAVAGIAVGLALFWMASSRVVAAIVVALAAASVPVVAATPAAQRRILSGLEATAKIQAGHVFTVGHAYKVLDAVFYAHPATPAASRLTMMPTEAARYVIRAGVSFFVVPLPWQLQSTRELAYLPEQLGWYVLILLLPAGAIAAARRDRLASCMLIGFGIPTAAVLALTNGNVGTLLRMRGLIVPYVAWLSAAGLHAIVTQGENRKRMPFIDPEGRLFGRVNLFDAMVIAFAIVLVPLAYGSYLLFRSPAVRITSVTRVPITREERRVAGGSTLAAKIKVHGTGLRPLLRASIDDTPAIALVFEDAHSADVLVGEVPPGTHDLVLYDGVQEVARAPKSVTIQPEPTQHVLAIGALTFADRASAEAAAPGVISRSAEAVRLGATRSDAGGVRRDAEIRFECDPDPSGEGCSVDGTLLTTPHPVVRVTTSAGQVRSFAVRELLPTTTPQETAARVRFTGPDEVLRRLRPGARDDCLDTRAATVADVEGVRGVGSTPSRDATLTLGIDRTAAGWSYRGRVFKVGAPFTLATEQYVVEGVVLTTGVEDAST